MRKIIVGDKYGDNRIMGNEQYDEYKAELKEKTGFDYMPGHLPHILYEENGILYEEHCGGLLSYIEEEPNKRPLDGEVMCPCGCKTFSISYGSYECFGTCGKCGKKYSLYSGWEIK